MTVFSQLLKRYQGLFSLCRYLFSYQHDVASEYCLFLYPVHDSALKERDDFGG